LKAGTNVLTSVAKKKVATVATLVLSTEAFPTAGLALQLEVPTAAASIRGPKVEEECWNTGLDDQLEAVVASIHLEMVVASCMQVEAVVVTTSKATLTAGDLPHSITGVGPIWEPCTIKVWLIHCDVPALKKDG
jgi:hypothetical protein